MSFNRRKFIQTMGLFSLTVPQLTFGKKQISDNIPYSVNPGFVTAPYIQNLTSDSVSIHVITQTNSYSWIEYGIDNTDHIHFESQHGMKVANCRIFNFKLNKLKPNTTYTYRIKSRAITKMSGYDIQYADEIVSDFYTFTTFEKQKSSCHVIVYNDLHDRKESISALWHLKKQAHTDLVIFNGDIFNQLYNEEQLINNFFKPINELFSTKIPFVYNRGNHETRGLYAREFINYIDYRDNKTYQAFELGPVFWIFIDSGEDKPDSNKEYFGLADYDKLRLAQRDWLLQIVKTKEFKKSKYKVVVMHIPPIHSGDWHGPKHCTELFVPIFNKYKIDVVYSGHTHNAKFHPPGDENKFALFIGGAPQNGKRTMMDIQANENSLLTQMIDDSGNIKHQWEIKR